MANSRRRVDRDGAEPIRHPDNSTCRRDAETIRTVGESDPVRRRHIAMTKGGAIALDPARTRRALCTDAQRDCQPVHAGLPAEALLLGPGKPSGVRFGDRDRA